MEQRQLDRALPEGTVLCRKYCLCKVLGVGGFGITYQGTTLEGDKPVAIKEFFPTDYAVREQAAADPVLHILQEEKNSFDRELKRFLREAHTLREFSYLDGIVTVLDYFEEHGTAYIVMEYIESVTMRQYVRYNGCLQYEELVSLLSPVIKAMIQIHKRGVVHRDISPDNLLFGLDNQAKLIDFGAVYSMDERPEHTKTVILKKGYAPPEQYLVAGDQGPWTDVYAMAATIYMGLTGRTPIDSVARLQGEELSSDCLVGKGLTDWQIQAIRTGMELKISDRYKNLDELLDALTIPPSAEEEITCNRKELQGKQKATARKAERTDRERILLFIRNRKMKWIALTGILVVAVGIFSTLYFAGAKTGNEKDSQKPSTKVEYKTENRVTETPSETGTDIKTYIYHMPDVRKLSEQDAIDRIHAEDPDMVVQMEKEYSEEIPKGFVVSQSVAGDTQYSAGAIQTVVLTISKGAEKAGSQPSDPNGNGSKNTPSAIPRVKSSPTPTDSSGKKTDQTQKKQEGIKVIGDKQDEYGEFTLGE